MNLDAFRQDEGSWKTLSFSKGTSEKYGDYCLNSENRMRAILLLQYDRQDDDEALIRYIFEQEVIARENDSFQGFGTTLSVAAHLLGARQVPSDAALFARAKFANFDTFCGFPAQYIFLAQREETLGFLDAEQPNLSEKLRDQMDGRPIPELDDWWKAEEAKYPSREDDEQPLNLYERHVQLGDLVLARNTLERWASEESDSRKKFSKLRYEYTELGEHAQAAEAAQELLQLAETDWDRASALRDLIACLRLAEELSLASSRALELDRLFQTFENWIGVGLGRMAIEEVYELVMAQPDLTKAMALFKLAAGWYARSGDLSYNGLQKAVEAAQHCELHSEASRFEALAKEERRRIDGELG